MRPAGTGDIPAMRAFLTAHADVAMFALSNLETEGLAVRGATNSPRSLHAWIDGDPVGGFIAITEEGMLLPVLPDDPAAHWAAAAPDLAGRSAFGISGEARAARAGLEVLGLSGHHAALDRDEPHFVLPLDELPVPDCAGMTCVRPDETLRPLMVEWRAAYHVETLGTRPEQAGESAERDIATAIARDTYRVLLRDGVPVSMAGLNAVAGDVVQVGGVYTPPELRRLGLARRAVALMLSERRGAGARRAVLFAASDMAARAYVAIGFRRIGEYTMLVFDPRARIAP